MTSAKPQSGPRLIRPFDEQPTVLQVLAAIVAPALLGAVAGWLLGVSAAAYVVVQVIATIGGFMAGLEHPDARAGAIRGVIGGTIFGSSILLVRGLGDRADQVSLGNVPALLVVITAVAGSILGAVGGHRSRIG